MKQFWKFRFFDGESEVFYVDVDNWETALSQDAYITIWDISFSPKSISRVEKVTPDKWWQDEAIAYAKSIWDEYLERINWKLKKCNWFFDSTMVKSFMEKWKDGAAYLFYLEQKNANNPMEVLTLQWGSN